MVKKRAVERRRYDSGKKLKPQSVPVPGTAARFLGSKPARSPPVWPFTERASRRIQIGADGAVDPEIEGAWVVRFLFRGVYPGPEADALAKWGFAVFRAHTPAVMWKGAEVRERR
jgi:hypothetical protein